MRAAGPVPARRRNLGRGQAGRSHTLGTDRAPRRAIGSTIRSDRPRGVRLQGATWPIQVVCYRTKLGLHRPQAVLVHPDQSIETLAPERVRASLRDDVRRELARPPLRVPLRTSTSERAVCDPAVTDGRNGSVCRRTGLRPFDRQSARRQSGQAVPHSGARLRAVGRWHAYCGRSLRKRRTYRRRGPRGKEPTRL